MWGLREESCGFDMNGGMGWLVVGGGLSPQLEALLLAAPVASVSSLTRVSLGTEGWGGCSPAVVEDRAVVPGASHSPRGPLRAGCFWPCAEAWAGLEPLGDLGRGWASGVWDPPKVKGHPVSPEVSVSLLSAGRQPWPEDRGGERPDWG